MTTVNGRLKWMILVVVLAGLSVAAASAITYAADLVLIQGHSRVMQYERVSRVAVGDESVIDVVALSPTQILVNAKGKGMTTLHVWENGIQEQYTVRVYADDGTLTAELASLIDLPQVQVQFIENTLILDGMVADPQERERAEKIAAAFSDRIINLLRYEETYDNPGLAQAVRQLIGEDLTVTVIYDTIILEGKLPNPEAQERAVALAAAFDRPVVDLLQVPVVEAPPEPDAEPDEEIAKPEEPSAAEVTAAAIDRTIQVYQWGDSLFLEGFMASDHEKERALAIAEAIHTPVVNLLRVRPADPEPVTEVVEPDEPEEPKEDPVDYASVARRLIGDPDLQVKLLFDQLILEGTAATEWDKHRAVTLAQVLPFPVVDLVQVAPDPEPDVEPEPEPAPKPLDPDEVAEAIDHPHIRVNWINRTLFLEGFVLDEFDKTRALKIAEAFTPTVVDLIRVQQPKPAVEESAEVPDSREQPEKTPDTAEQQPELPPESDEPEVDEAKFYRELLEDVEAALREPDVTAAFHRETLVLEGNVLSEAAKERAESIASFYYQPVHSFIQVQEPEGPMKAEEIARLLNSERIDVTEVEDTIILSGEVDDQAEHSRAMEIAQLYGPVMDLLHVSRPAQVIMQVHVLEMSRSEGRDIGITWGSLHDVTGEFMPSVVRFEEVNRVGSFEFLRSFPLSAEIRAMVDEGDAKLLAAPSLLTMSGEEASFLAGGEIPVVVGTGDDAQVTWREYGVRLQILPWVKQNQILVEINPEVSSLDWTNAVTLNGQSIPALKTRRTNTKVQVDEGSTVILGGLIEHEERQQVRKVPILGDLPILGALFRSTQYQERETELVIMITPWIVYPGGGGTSE